jgi:hypothetical protein
MLRVKVDQLDERKTFMATAELCNCGPTVHEGFSPWFAFV